MGTKRRSQIKMLAYGSEESKLTKYIAKKYFRLQECAELYSIGMNKTRELAEEAEAIYKVDSLVLVNIELFERYLETFRVTR